MRIVRNAAPPPPPDRFGWPVLCVLPIEPADVPDAEWFEYVEDGLGEASGACVEVEGGILLGLVRYHHLARPGLDVFALVPPERLPDALDAVLAATGLRREELPWIAEQECLDSSSNGYQQ